ncbi:hypothetical protein BaRGS_00019481 [Batillaria attramentaria]|uniref:Uncharacterized protein n=1 Tax=Batillaria attramentaria TaxID=370345 RepID=A0ABD0KQ23_9CAEN
MEGSQGHVGNLQQKTLTQLQELLDRQEKLLAKQKFLESLPDRGEKVKRFARTLRQLIEERQTSSQDTGSLRVTSGIVQQKSPVKDRVSDFASLRDRSDPVRDGSTVAGKDGQLSVLEALSQPRGHFTDVVAESVHADGDDQHRDEAAALSERLQEMVVSDAQDRERHTGTKQGAAHNTAGGEVLFQNSYETVIRSNAENSGKRAPFKPNSTLKVATVKDLPQELKEKLRVASPQVSVQTKESSEKSCQEGVSDLKPVAASHPKVPEESAVHPPPYHFQKVKMISVEDSIELERQQRQELERIQAEHAAERLAERLHIKMDEYNAPSVDMQIAQVSE